MAKKQFKAESKKLLDMMINSIYTHKEIFLREIISNASDAIDKLCYQSLTDENVGMARSDFKIRVTPDKDARTITVSDNGIGMTKEELDSNLGVIARSGSLKFKDGLGENAQEDAAIDIIGQFGVGFYSAFMVADKVTVVTRAYGSDTAYQWVSTGADGYTITETEKDTVGTDVIMHIKEDESGEKYSTYLENWKLMMLIRKYSDYVRWPIVMDVEQSDWVDTGEKDEKGEPKMEMVTKTEEQTINSMVPIWQRSRKEATDEECIAFYKDKFHDKDDPLAVIRVNAEGLISYRALLFIPAKAPANMFTRESDPGLELYSSGVMIMDKCTDLLPPCYAFARGVVDSPDLSLNISREMLQHDRQLKLIATNLGKKIKSELTKLMTNDREKYEQFHAAFGMMLRAGAVTETGDKVDEIKDLLLYHTSETKLVSLKEYVDAMPAEQTKIYFACGENVKRLLSLPQAEQLHDPFAEVALDGVDAAFAQEGRQAALLGEHRLALDEVPSAVFADETPYGVVHLGGVARPVHRDAVGRGVALEFEQVVAQTAQRVAFDFGGELPQLLPFGDRLHHPVAFFAYGVERPVVPRHAVGVGDESLCG